MMKPKGLIALLIVLAVLLGSYIYISYQPKKDSKAQEESKKIELSKLDENKITKMTLSSGKGNLIFEKRGSSWVLEGNPGVKLDQSAINALTKSFANLYSDKLVSEDSKEFENFGLKTPVVTASAVLDGGGETTLYVGNKTPQGNTYYAMLKDISKVYTIPAEDGKHFSYTLADVRDKSVSNLNAKEISYINVIKQDGKTIELKKSTRGSIEEQEFDSDTWVMIKPYKSTYRGDELKISDMTGKIGEMKIEGFVEDNPTDYVKYGLDKPVMDITVKDSSGTMRVLFGKDKDESQVYFRVDGSKAVYTMKKESMEVFSSKPFDIVSKELRVAQSSNLSRMSIEGLGRKDTFTVTRTVKPPSKPEEKETEDLRFSLNGKDIEDGDFYLSFNTVMGLSVEAENDKQVDEKAELRVILDFYKGVKKQTVLSFCPYNEDFYAVFKDGKADFLISKQQVAKALDQIKQVENKYNK